MAAAASAPAAAIATDVPTGLQHHNPLVDDVEARHSRLSSDRERLFADAQISIDVLDVDRSAGDGKRAGWLPALRGCNRDRPTDR